MAGFAGTDGLRALATVLNTELESNFNLSVSARDVIRRFLQIPDTADFTLDLNVDPTSGTDQISSTIALGASQGASPVIGTNLDVFDSSGKSILGFQNHYLGGEALQERGSFSVGSYRVNAVRTAATKHGPASLTRSVDIQVSKKGSPTPTPTPIPTCSVDVNEDQTTDSGEVLTISGSGMQPGESVTIDEWIDPGDNKLEPQPTFSAVADSIGGYSNNNVGVTRTSPPTTYVFQATGDTSKRQSPRVSHRTS
jgi:hypothetical protein